MAQTIDHFTLPRQNADMLLLWQSCKSWWQSLDKWLLYLSLSLAFLGLILVFAAGPAAAARIGIDNSFHFIQRQLVFVIPSILLIIALSALPLRFITRVMLLAFVAGAGLLALVTFFGQEVNGAKRWLFFGPFSLQPSEFVKVGFIIFTSWALAVANKVPEFKGGAYAFAAYGLLSFLLLMQPDYGQWMLLSAVWAVVLFVAGWRLIWLMIMGVAGSAVLLLGYFTAPHVAARIDRFLNPSTGDNYQVEKAIQAIEGGGLLGHDFLNQSNGVKHQLPDSHTDFIFAVAVEEFGFLLGALIIGLFLVLVGRALYLAAREHALFSQCAISGLSALLGFQALINVGVNLQLLPAKGMTLPFISYGGSSFLAMGLVLGLLLALTKRRYIVMPYEHEKTSIFQ